MNHRRGSIPFRVRNEFFLLRVRAACPRQASAHVVRLRHPLSQGWRRVKQRHHPVTGDALRSILTNTEKPVRPQFVVLMGTHGGEASPPATVSGSRFVLQPADHPPGLRRLLAPRWVPELLDAAEAPLTWCVPSGSSGARVRGSVARCELRLNLEDVNPHDALKRPNHSDLLARFLRC
ncbi:unnamed protein product [Pleuronectes platessa]|uniref:Uncharacterized protein n=1 Tax=Pleuronectes platessa TaxID=8262 RepID=A0A9N7TKD9_PLEPL|nr:unnamed protein product [Pleuronectes platessa]